MESPDAGGSSSFRSGASIPRNFFSLSCANVFSRFLMAAAFVYLARTLEPGGLGRLSFAQAVVAYFAIMTDMGLTILGIREVARDRSKLEGYVANILGLRLGLSLFSFALLSLSTLLIGKLAEARMLVILCGLTLLPGSFALGWVFKAVERMHIVAIGDALQAALYACLVFLFVRSSEDVLRVPAFLIAGTVAVTVMVAGAFVRRHGWFAVRFDPRFWRALLRKALPLGFSFILVQIYYNIDTVMLGFMKGDKVVGWYNAAYKPVFLLMGFVALLGQSVLPRLSQLALGSAEEKRRFISQLCALVICVALPVALGSTLAGRNLISLAYGAEYEPSTVAFQILVWQAFIVAAAMPFAYSLVAFEKVHLYLYSVGAASTLNVLLNLALIPKYGVVGAAAATIAAEALVLVVIYLIVSRKIVMIPIAAALPKVTLIAVVLFTVPFALGANWAISMGLGSLLYGFTVALGAKVTRGSARSIWQGLR